LMTISMYGITNEPPRSKLRGITRFEISIVIERREARAYGNNSNR
jgi:hypothetical protein